MPIPHVSIVMQSFPGEYEKYIRTWEVVAVFETDEQAEKYIAEEVAEYQRQKIDAKPENFSIHTWEVHR